MVKCEILTSTEIMFIQREVECYYSKYEVLDVKFSTATCYEYVLKYSVMIIYKEK